MVNQSQLQEGKRISVLYPTHGKLNVFSRQTGFIERVVNNPNKGFPFVDIRRQDGSFRRLNLHKMAVM